MATYEDLQAAIDAIRQAHPGWDPLHPADAKDSLFAQGLQAFLRQPHGPLAEVADSAFQALRQLAPPGSFTPSGQLVNAPPGAPNLPSPNAPLSPPQNIPGPPPGAPIDRTVAAPQNELDKLRGDPGFHVKTAKSVPHDPIPTYFEGYKATQDVTESGPGNTGWDSTINGIRDRLKRGLKTLDGGIEGEFGKALRANLEQSFAVLDDLSTHARTMETLIEAFFNDLATTKGNFAKNWELYRQAMQDPDEPNNKETLNQLNALVGPIMAQYRPPIDTIATSHPSISSALPGVGSPGPARGGSGSPGGPGGGIPAGLPMSGLGSGIPTMPDAAQADPSKAPSMPSIPTDAANGAADAAKQAGDQAQKAGSQAGNAGQKALDALTGAQKGSGLPEGVLGLGPKGLQGAAKSGGGTGGRGGAGGRDPAAVKTPAKLAGTGGQAAKVASAASAASRAGLSGAGAPGGAGAPAAGHRGAAGDKTHKANKALRVAKNGEELMDEADAVTSVIGEEPRRPKPPDQKT